MKAVQLVGYGDPVENVRVFEVAEPSPPGPGEVLVGVEYAPVNFNDLMVVRGAHNRKPHLPATIGNEGGGVVLAVGDGVTSVAVGDRVVLIPSDTLSTYQQRVVVPVEDVVVAPRGADPRQVAMMAINPVSAALLLDEFVALEAGDAVAFNAATSGMARWLIALAEERGVRTIGLVRRAADREAVVRRGCDVAFVDDEPVEAVLEGLRGLEVRLGLDVLGGPSALRLLQMLGDRGTLVVYGSVTGEPLRLPGSLVLRKGLTLTGFYEMSPEMAPKIRGVLGGLVERLRPGGIEQPVAGVYTLDGTEEAFALAGRGKRVLLRLDGDRGR